MPAGELKAEKGLFIPPPIPPLFTHRWNDTIQAPSQGGEEWSCELRFPPSATF